MTNVSNKNDIDKTEKSEKRLAIQLRNDYRSVLETRAGRNVLYDLLSSCHVYSSVFAEGNVIYFNEGERNVGLKLMASISEASPDMYLQMIKENMEEEPDDA